MEKSCGIYIVNKNNELLIIHPTQSPIDKNWGIPKGKIDGNETHFETAIRELKEETNLSLVGINGYCIELPESVYKSKRKTLYPYFVKVNEFDSDTLVECVSYFTNKNGELLPENDDYMWLNIYDPKLLEIMHEAQLNNLELIKTKYLN